MILGVAGLRPNFFSSGRIFLAELAPGVLAGSGSSYTHTSVSVSAMLQEGACVLSTSAPPLHCPTHSKDKKLKFILQIE
jgi:hypothetical protein